LAFNDPVGAGLRPPSIGTSCSKIAVMAGAAYLSKNLFSIADGKFLGKLG